MKPELIACGIALRTLCSRGSFFRVSRRHRRWRFARVMMRYGFAVAFGEFMRALGSPRSEPSLSSRSGGNSSGPSDAFGTAGASGVV